MIKRPISDYGQEEASLFLSLSSSPLHYVSSLSTSAVSLFFSQSMAISLFRQSSDFSVSLSLPLSLFLSLYCFSD